MANARGIHLLGILYKDRRYRDGSYPAIHQPEIRQGIEVPSKDPAGPVHLRRVRSSRSALRSIPRRFTGRPRIIEFARYSVIGAGDPTHPEISYGTFEGEGVGGQGGRCALNIVRYSRYTATPCITMITAT
jgi:hypothetical protein